MEWLLGTMEVQRLPVVIWGVATFATVAINVALLLRR